MREGGGSICESKVREPKIAAFNEWTCLDTAWKRRETLIDEEVLGPEPSERGEYLRIHVGQLGFAVFLVSGMLVRREGLFLLLPDLFVRSLSSLGPHCLEPSVLEDF